MINLPHERTLQVELCLKCLYFRHILRKNILNLKFDRSVLRSFHLKYQLIRRHAVCWDRLRLENSLLNPKQNAKISFVKCSFTKSPTENVYIFFAIKNETE